MQWDNIDKKDDKKEEKSSKKNEPKPIKKKVEQIKAIKSEVKEKPKPRQRSQQKAIVKEKIIVETAENVFHTTRGLSLVAASYKIPKYGDMKKSELLLSLSNKFKEEYDKCTQKK